VLLLVLFIAGTFISSLTLAPGASKAAVGSIVRTTTSLNLRSGPGTQYGVVLTMPAGAQFKITGSLNKGFYPGRYNGTKGWASADYLSTTGTAAPAAPSNGSAQPDYVGDTLFTTTSLNLRSGASTGHGVVLTMPAGASFKITGTLKNGFYPGRYNGTKGWASADYLSYTRSSTAAPPSSGSTAKPDYVGDTVYTTTNLNLRSGPGTGYGVVTNMSLGSAFKITGTLKNGFYPGRFYGSTVGWASADYLSYTRPSTPTPPPSTSTPKPDYVGDTVYATTNMNLRSGPGTGYGVVTTIPRGAAFKITGTLKNGFYPGRYDGSTVGWASADLLSYTQPSNGNGNGNGNGSGVVAESGAGPGADGVWSEGEIINLIYEAADYYGQPREDMLRVARCESLLNPSLIHPAYQASGLFQFLPGTWATTPYAGFYILDPVANAYAAAWMWSVGRRGEWVCQ